MPRRFLSRKLSVPRLSEDERAEVIAFAQQLVRVPSLSTQESAIARLIQDELRRLGVQDVWVDRVGNVIAEIGPKEGPILLYNGHMDTVAVSNRDSWERDPYGGDIEDGVLYGLGASDMKGSLAAMVHSTRLILRYADKLKGRVVMAFVVQEEPCEGHAMRILVEEEGLRPDWVLLGEPTDMKISRGQRGRVMFKVTTLGRSSHASRPDLGENAVYAAAKLIFGIELLASELPRDPFLGPGTVAVTRIISQSPSLNAVPDTCTLYIDRRLTLGETVSQALAQLEALIGREELSAEVEITMYRASSYTGYRLAAKEAFPAWVLDKNHPLVTNLIRTVEETLGHQPQICHWAFSTDGVYTMGVANIPTVGFGPGNPDHAHTPNDQVRLEDVVRATEVYGAFPMRMLR